jgi:hypothetical protein
MAFSAALLSGFKRPFEPIFFQALLPQAKTVAIPIQDL